LAAVLSPSTQLTAPPDLLQLLQGLQRLQRLLRLQALHHAAIGAAATAAGSSGTAGWQHTTVAARLGSLLLQLLLLPRHFNQACNGVVPA
jgi:hypothetical protein